MTDLVRHPIAYSQAVLGAAEWARDAVQRGEVESYSELGSCAWLRKLGVTAVGSAIERVPNFSVHSVLGKLVLDELDIVSIGAEAVVIDEGETVRKVLTGKTENPDTLAPRLEQRLSGFQRFFGDYAVATKISVEPLRVFKWLPEMDYVSAVQPKLDIVKQDALEDDSFIAANPGVKQQLVDVISKQQRYAELTADVYDVAKEGNVVFARQQEFAEAGGEWRWSEPRVRLPDVMIANLADTDFVGLRHFGLWNPQVYRAAANRHSLRLGA